MLRGVYPEPLLPLRGLRAVRKWWANGHSMTGDLVSSACPRPAPSVPRAILVLSSTPRALKCYRRFSAPRGCPAAPWMGDSAACEICLLPVQREQNGCVAGTDTDWFVARESRSRLGGTLMACHNTKPSRATTALKLRLTLAEEVA